MTHINYAKSVVVDKKSIKHRNQKTYKKFEKKECYKVNTKKPSHEEMYTIAAQWWDNWKDNDFIRNLTKGYNKADNTSSKNAFLTYQYKKYERLVPNWSKLITLDFFIYQFSYCIPQFYTKWIEEETLINRKYITGELELQIISFLNGKKSTKNERLFKHFEFEHFEAKIKEALTKMSNKKYITKTTFGDSIFYCLNNEIIDFDGSKWFVK